MFSLSLRQRLCPLLLSGLIGLLGACQHAERDRDTIALMRFNHAVSVDQSTAPSNITADPTHSLVAGKIGRALALNGDARIILTGEALNRVSPRQGTLECWLNQQWSGAEPGIREIFSIEFDDGYIKTHWAQGHLNVNSAFDGQYRHAFYHDAGSWQANAWHHVALSWSYADGYTAVDLYVDHKHVAGFLGALAKEAPHRIVIGGPFKKRAYPDAPVVYDEVRLGTRARHGLQSDELEPGPSTAMRLGTGDTDDVVIWTESASRKVFQDQALPPEDAIVPHVTLCAAINEYEPIQLVITSKRNIADVRVAVTDLTGPGMISKQHVSVCRVRNVQVDFPSGRFGKTGPHPDPLPPTDMLDLEADRHATLWLTVRVPSYARPGRYRGVIELAGDRFTQRIPLKLTVWNFALPARPTLSTLSLIRPQYIPNQRFEPFYKNLAAHRVTGMVGMRLAQHLRAAKGFGRPELNHEIDLLIERLGFEHIVMPGVGWISHQGTHRWPDGLKWRGRYPYFVDEARAVLHPDFKRAFASALRPQVALLEQQGALDRLVFWYQDEMSWDHGPTLRKSVAMARFIKGIEPRVKIMQTKYPHRDLLPYVDIWCVHSDHYDAHVEIIDHARRNGKQVWIYNNGIPIIDYPAIRSRMFPWILWKRNIAGSFCYWSLNEWQNPTWAARHQRLAGSGLLLYPARDGTDDPVPVNSIRWELLREGLEDVEYLRLLSKRITAAKTRGRNVARAERLLVQAKQMVEGLPRVSGLPDQPYTLDAGALMKLRREIAEAIVRFGDVETNK